MRGLGSRPLADVLFKRTGISRQPLAFGKLVRTSPVQRHAAAGWSRATGQSRRDAALPARRSVFVRRGCALLVMEVFAAPGPSWVWSPAARKVKKCHRSRV
ncbi:chorismate pyruvate-lyase [mine drainage metagenome]|uniref:Chorismate pyruvate-lyase n=1 Tax=mine drainage metagenome TaxID=410659 RepID=A0A1J5PNJ4_9ZZZZ